MILVVNQLQTQGEMLEIMLGPQDTIGIRGGQKARVSSIPVKVFDAVAEGDSFDAGFIYGYVNDWLFDGSLGLGIEGKVLSTRKAGGTAAQPTLLEAIEYF